MGRPWPAGWLWLPLLDEWQCRALALAASLRCLTTRLRGEKILQSSSRTCLQPPTAAVVLTWQPCLSDSGKGLRCSRVPTSDGASLRMIFCCPSMQYVQESEQKSFGVSALRFWCSRQYTFKRHRALQHSASRLRYHQAASSAVRGEQRQSMYIGLRSYGPFSSS